MSNIRVKGLGTARKSVKPDNLLCDSLDFTWKAGSEVAKTDI